MSQSARVLSIETVQQFRNALCEFGKDVQDTLCAVDMQIRRTMDWLAEQGRAWHREIKVREEELTRAKIELESRKYQTRDGHGPGYSVQEKAFRKSKARLDEAQAKLANCRRWKPLLEHAIREYYGRAHQLSAAADADLQQSLALLDRKLAALEAYLAVAPPPTTDLTTGAVATPGSVQMVGSEVPSEVTVDKIRESDTGIGERNSPGFPKSGE